MSGKSGRMLPMMACFENAGQFCPTKRGGVVPVYSGADLSPAGPFSSAIHTAPPALIRPARTAPSAGTAAPAYGVRSLLAACQGLLCCYETTRFLPLGASIRAHPPTTRATIHPLRCSPGERSRSRTAAHEIYGPRNGRSLRADRRLGRLHTARAGGAVTQPARQ